jgi:anti-sigma-K factor RskA
MSGIDPADPDESLDLLAAEYVLGLLTGSTLLEARRRFTDDPQFAQAVADWESRLMPLASEAPAVVPADTVWAKVREQIKSQPEASAEIVVLRRRVRQWQGAAAGLAIAASLALALGLQRADSQNQSVIVQPGPTPAPLMIAALASPAEETLASVAYDPIKSELVVTPGRLGGAAGHDHELWVIPAGGKPVSLGLVRARAGLQRVAVGASLTPHFRSHSTLAISVEPVGGSPTGQPTGPVVASGEMIIV